MTYLFFYSGAAKACNHCFLSQKEEDYKRNYDNQRTGSKSCELVLLICYKAEESKSKSLFFRRTENHLREDKVHPRADKTCKSKEGNNRTCNRKDNLYKSSEVWSAVNSGSLIQVLWNSPKAPRDIGRLLSEELERTPALPEQRNNHSGRMAKESRNLMVHPEHSNCSSNELKITILVFF